MKRLHHRSMSIVLAVIMAFGFMPAMHGKVKLTPTIEFSGKGKNKIPSGNGILEFTYNNKKIFGYISGDFKDSLITNAKIRSFTDEVITGSCVYKVSYDKKSKVTRFSIKLLDGNLGTWDYPIVSGFPILSFQQTDKEKPIRTFDLTTFKVAEPVEVHYLHHKFPYREYEMYSKGDNGLIGFKEVCYVSKNGYKITKNNYSNGYNIISKNGNKCITTDYRIKTFEIRSKDGGVISAELEVKKSSGYNYRDTYHPFYTLKYPNGDSFAGKIEDGCIYDILNDRKSGGTFKQFQQIVEILENSNIYDLKFQDGILTKSTGEKIEYTKGYTEADILSIRNSEPVIVEVKKAGTLLSSISPDKLKTIRNLSIVGYLDETDLKIITELGAELVKLDLSLAYTSLSEKARSEQAANSEAVLALFGLMGKMADAQYNNYEISTSDYVSVKSFTTIIEQSASNVKKADKNCIIPSNVLNKLPKLVDIKLPIWCSRIENSLNSLPLLRYVSLPPKLRTIGDAFKHCPNLRNVDFPASLNDIGKDAFKETVLEKVDLSKCNWYRFGDWGLPYRSFPTKHKVLWRGLPVTKELKLPKDIECIDGLGLKTGGTLYCPKTLEYSDVVMKGLTLYCQSPTPFKLAQNGSVKDCVIYVPKGSVTAWYAAFGKDNKIIEY